VLHRKTDGRTGKTRNVAYTTYGSIATDGGRAYLSGGRRRPNDCNSCQVTHSETTQLYRAVLTYVQTVRLWLSWDLMKSSWAA